MDGFPRTSKMSWRTREVNVGEKRRNGAEAKKVQEVSTSVRATLRVL
jgi:hypothetical protein